MRPATIAQALATAGAGELVLIEGVTGLFDAAADGTGSTADLAAALALPIILVVDVGGMGASVAALVEGFRHHRADVEVVAVILNRIGSTRHESFLRRALPGVEVLGCIPRASGLALPSRHLGLVQAREHAELEAFITAAAEAVARCVDLDRVMALAGPLPVLDPSAGDARLPAPGQRVAVASDAAFAFRYPGVLDGWHAAGAELAYFSPLADMPPPPYADAVYLPGGYPELHADRLAGAATFTAGLRTLAADGAVIYGECGGYMVLGRALIDAAGRAWPMAGLLPVVTSFARPQRHLGYRRITTSASTFLGPVGAAYRGHEFHYASEVERHGPSLFTAATADGEMLGPQGCVQGNVAGSFLHLVDREG
jgi:cobyrinic acid a,c-diamide synthase